MIYVIRDGELVEKDRGRGTERSRLPSPMLSRMTPFESPIDGREISSWRERDADMRAANAYDPRDLPKDHQMKRGRGHTPQAEETASGRRADPFWRP
jgi:hypothetical protein